MILYGLKNCDTCKKVRKELDAASVAVEFHDLRDDGVTKSQIEKWAKAAGWEAMLNKSSTTWRGLADADKLNVDEKKAIALMAANPTLIKRPIIEKGPTQVFVGWSKDVQAKVLKR
ncbi:MAG: Spx/MgsR family RNA polymerase-binding regulatory protein [Parvularculaceae bacterium]